MLVPVRLEKIAVTRARRNPLSLSTTIQIQKKKSKKMVVTKHEDRGKYFHCKKDRHRRRNYPNYLDYLKSKKTKPSEDMST